MNKLIKKTTATLLIAAFMISTFALAIAGPTDYWFTQDLLGQAGLVSGVGHSSNNCARLYIPGSGDIDDDAKLRIPYTGTLESLVTFSYWTMVKGTDGGLHPYGSINIDSTGDTLCDYVIVQWEVSGYAPEGADIWVETTFDDTTRIHVVSATTGLELPGFGQTDAKTLGQLKEVSGWTGYDVLQVKLAVGMWAIDYPLKGFVDDVTVNDVIYDFEHAVTMTTTATVPKIGIIISPTSVDFGEVVLGKVSASKWISITSTSETTIKVTATLIDPDSFYAECLRIDDYIHYYNWQIDSLAEGAYKDVELKLDVPRTQSPGTHAGTLVFWAEETP